MLRAQPKVAERLAGALDKSEMYGGIAYVKAGVTHIMKRQQEGWAYIRP